LLQLWGSKKLFLHKMNFDLEIIEKEFEGKGFVINLKDLGFELHVLHTKSGNGDKFSSADYDDENSLYDDIKKLIP